MMDEPLTDEELTKWFSDLDCMPPYSIRLRAAAEIRTLRKENSNPLLGELAASRIRGLCADNARLRKRVESLEAITGLCPECQLLKKEKTMPDTKAQREMPRYKCHKIVHALKIAKIEPIGSGEPNTETDGGALIVPAEEGYAPFRVDYLYMKHQPEVGGYYVVYSDGYKSFSPAEAFEEGYTRVS